MKKMLDCLKEENIEIKLTYTQINYEKEWEKIEKSIKCPLYDKEYKYKKEE